MIETREQRLDRQAEFGMTQREAAEYDRLAERDYYAALSHKAAHEALIRQAYAQRDARQRENEE